MALFFRIRIVNNFRTTSREQKRYIYVLELAE